MAMTTSEMIEFFAEQAQGTRRGMDAARSTGNYQLAALNCRQAFKCRLMKGLVEWRTEIDPTDSMNETVEGFVDDWATAAAIGGDDANPADVPADRVTFVAYLIGKPITIDVSSVGFGRDRLLDLVLGHWLIDSWNGEWWNQGMNQLRQAGSDLAIRTYELYRAVVDRGGSTGISDLSQQGEVLFGERKSDGFFCGGDQTEGGGDDNHVTVDYRLAALLKRANADSFEGLHVWKW